LELFKIFEVKLNIDVFSIFLISQESNKRFKSGNNIVGSFLEISFKSFVDKVDKFLSDVVLSEFVGEYSLLIGSFSV
jgi:hypothetical protein